MQSRGIGEKFSISGKAPQQEVARMESRGQRGDGEVGGRSDRAGLLGPCLDPRLEVYKSQTG